MELRCELELIKTARVVKKVERCVVEVVEKGVEGVESRLQNFIVTNWVSQLWKSNSVRYWSFYWFLKLKIQKKIQ